MYPPVFGLGKKLDSPLIAGSISIPAGCDVYVSTTEV